LQLELFEVLDAFLQTGILQVEAFLFELEIQIFLLQVGQIFFQIPVVLFEALRFLLQIVDLVLPLVKHFLSAGDVIHLLRAT
jgi:hypothetical protein